MTEQPTTYTPTTAFSSFNPSAFPNLGVNLDVELENVSTSLDETQARLLLIQRDDGELANDSVGPDQLENSVFAGINTPTAWVTLTDYTVRDSAFILTANYSKWYKCLVTHTSGVFATDLSAGYWELILNTDIQAVDDALADAEAAAAAAAADVVLTHADVVLTHADVVLTHADVVLTHADVVLTQADVVTAAASAAAAAATAAGTAAFKWSFSTTTAMADPGTGVLRLNNATVGSATAVALSSLTGDSGNPDVSDFVITWDDSTHTPKGTLTIRKSGAPATFTVFSVGAVTDNGTWLQVALTYVTGNGALSAADVLYLGFSRAGDNGTGIGDMLGANNLSDVANAATAFATIKQAATASVTGVVLLPDEGNNILLAEVMS